MKHLVLHIGIVCNGLLSYGYLACPVFLQSEWIIIGKDSVILPDGLSCQTILKMHIEKKSSENSQKNLETDKT